MKNYYQKEIETASREEILAIQNEKIVRQVKHVYENVPYYKKLMDDKGVKPENNNIMFDLVRQSSLDADLMGHVYYMKPRINKRKDKKDETIIEP